MTRRPGKLQQLREQVAESHQRKSPSLVGERITESGVLDRAILNEQIGTILEGMSANPSLSAIMEQRLQAFLEYLNAGDVPAAALEVSALLGLELDDLRRAALLSLMVRLAGKKKFDPVAAYVLEKLTPRAARV
jgi:hypothetical protein